MKRTLVPNRGQSVGSRASESDGLLPEPFDDGLATPSLMRSVVGGAGGFEMTQLPA